MEKLLVEQAALELGAVDTGQLLVLLECPVCLDHITPPIKQCIKGHLVCSDCFPRLPHCPTCRSEMSAERNLGMEQVSRLLNFPCRYHPMGCKVAVPLSLKAAHERNCEYLQLKCPFHGQCSFQGGLAMVVPHLKADHNVNPVPIRPNGILFYRAKQFSKRNLWNFIFEWDGNMFRFLVKNLHASNVGRPEVAGNLVIAHVQYVGPDSMASQYSYSMAFFNTKTLRPGFEFQGVVSSTMKSMESQVGQPGKEEVFVANSHLANLMADSAGQLNFVIHMKSAKGKADREAERSARDAESSSRRRQTESSATRRSLHQAPPAAPVRPPPAAISGAPAALSVPTPPLANPAMTNDTPSTSSSSTQPTTTHTSSTSSPASTSSTSNNRDDSPQPGTSSVLPPT